MAPHFDTWPTFIGLRNWSSRACPVCACEIYETEPPFSFFSTLFSNFFRCYFFFIFLRLCSLFPRLLPWSFNLFLRFHLYSWLLPSGKSKLFLFCDLLISPCSLIVFRNVFAFVQLASRFLWPIGCIDYGMKRALGCIFSVNCFNRILVI